MHEIHETYNYQLFTSLTDENERLSGGLGV